jgi:predicted DNA-binding WGR domain protein
MTRRFEYTDATSSKFWEITVTDATVTVCYGRISAAGKTQTKPHGSAAAATAAAEQQVAEKVKKGCREVGVDAAPTTARSTAGEPSPTTAADAAVDRKQRTEIRKLLGQADAAAVWQGITLLRALDNPALWAMLAEGARVDAEGEVHTSSGSEIHKRVRAGFRASLAVWALAGSGRLGDTRRLRI